MPAGVIAGSQAAPRARGGAPKLSRAAQGCTGGGPGGRGGAEHMDHAPALGQAAAAALEAHNCGHAWPAQPTCDGSVCQLGLV